MKEEKLNKIISIIRDLREDGEMSISSAPTNSTNSSGQINIAGLPPDQPPVDLRRKKNRNWNPFFKNLAKVQKRIPPQP